VQTEVEVKQSMENCDECGGVVSLVDGEYVCRSCGLVHEQKLESPRLTVETEVKEVFLLQQRSHTAPGERLHMVDGLGSYLGYPNSFYFHDSNGVPLAPTNQRFFSRLKYIYDKRARFSGHETDYRTLSSLNRVAEMLRLPPSVRDRAAHLYRKAIRASTGNRYSTSIVLMAYCLLLATREIETPNPIMIKEIAHAFRKLGHRVSNPMIIKAGLHYKTLLDAKPKMRRSEEYLNKALQFVVSSNIVASELSKFNLTPQQYKKALFTTSLDLLRRIKNQDRRGRSPYVFAVSTIYAADRLLAKENHHRPFLTQRSLAELTGVAEYSIREHYCTLLKDSIKQNSHRYFQ